MIAPDGYRWTVAAVLLVAVLVWAPLPYGSVTPGGELLVRLAACLLLGVVLWGAASWRELRPVVWPAGAVAALAVLGWLQAAPWPAGLVALLSPERLRIERLAEQTAGVAPAGWVPLSLAPEVSRSTALSIASVAAVLLAAAAVGSRRRGRRWIAAALFAGAVLQPAAGARRLLAGVPEATPGSALAEPTNRLIGSFVHPNQLALLLEIALAVAVAVVWWAWSGARRRGPDGIGPGHLVGAVLLLAALAVSLVLTRSRAGILGAAAAAVVQSGALLVALGFRWRRLAILAGGAAAVGAVALTVLRRPLGRLLETPLGELVWAQRAEVWSETVELWTRFPLVGSGLGTFADGLPLVESAALTGGTWLHAHNQWVELLATGGVLGAAVVAVGLVALVRRLAAVLGSAIATEERAAALAALGALTAAGVHELFDFSLTAPANAIALAAVCGAAAGVPLIQPLRSGPRPDRGTDLSGSPAGDGGRLPETPR